MLSTVSQAPGGDEAQPPAMSELPDHMPVVGVGPSLSQSTDGVTSSVNASCSDLHLSICSEEAH